jgi:polysaccharide biosynthesis protein PslH
MKILILCNKPPYPPKDGGAIGIFNLSRTLASLGHTVFILAMNTSKHKVKTTEAVAIPNLTIKYVEINTDINLFKALKNLIFSKLPFIAERFISREYLIELKKVLIQNTFEVIQFEGPYLWFCIETVRELTNAKIAMKSHNIENEIWKRSAQLESNYLKKLYLYNLAARIEKFEILLYNRFDYIYAVTPRDKEVFLTMGVTKPILVVPTGIDPPKKDILPDNRNNSIFHLGALDWLPNQEGLLWFINKVWPGMVSKYPELKFHIAGRNAPSWIVKNFNKPNIIYHGEIEDSYTFISQSGIMIVPILSGSGMRVKIVEGMSLGKAIITTSIGAEGLDVKDGVDLLIADTVEEFLIKLSLLIENKELTTTISINAHKNAIQKYNNNDIAKNVVEFYKTHGVIHE